MCFSIIKEKVIGEPSDPFPSSFLQLLEQQYGTAFQHPSHIRTTDFFSRVQNDVLATPFVAEIKIKFIVSLTKVRSRLDTGTIYRAVHSGVPSTIVLLECYSITVHLNR